MDDKQSVEPAKDGMLVRYIKAVEKTEKTEEVPPNERHLDIVVSVSGLLIAGELISYDTYLGEAFGEEDASSEPSDDEEKETTPPPEDRHFIHLRNAKFYVSSGNPVPGVGDGFLWRGRLTSVDGFAVGSLNTVKREPQKLRVAGVEIEV